MLSIAKRKFMSLAEVLHLRIFGHEMSPMMDNFLKSLSWSFVGIIISAGLFAIINILAGRLLGPQGYGKYNLVIALCSILSIPIVLGLDVTSVKFISGSSSESEKKQYLSNSFWIVCLSSSLFFLILITFSSLIRNFLGGSKNYVLLIVFFSIAVSFKSLFDSFIKSFYLFKFQAIAKIIEAVLVTLSFVMFFYLFHFNNYAYYVSSMLIGAATLCFLYFIKIRKFIVRWNKAKLGDIISYSKTTLSIAIITTLMISLDKVFVGKFLGEESLGIFSAYLTASMVFIMQLVTVTNNVFLPMVNNAQTKYPIIKKIDRLTVLFIIPGSFLIFCCSAVIMYFFGKEFETSLIYILIFSILAFLQIPINLYRNVIYSVPRFYSRLKNLSYITFIIFIVFYSSLSVHGLNKFYIVVAIYSLLTVWGLIISRFGYNFEKNDKLIF